MPKTPIDYSKACIYQICCKDLSIKDVYVGSTTNLIERRRLHKSSCNNENGRGYNFTVYRFIREHGGFDNWEVIKVEDAPVTCREDLLNLERVCMVRLKATLNKNVPNRSEKEYHEMNREKRLEQMKEYNDANKIKIAKKKKQNYEANKTTLIEKSKLHYEANKTEIAEKRAVKVTCQCGSVFRKGSLSVHIKSKKHQGYLLTTQKLD